MSDLTITIPLDEYRELLRKSIEQEIVEPWKRELEKARDGNYWYGAYHKLAEEVDDGK